MTEAILKIKKLGIEINRKDAKKQKIVQSIDLVIPKGEIVGIVGESGSGKSMTMKSLMNILPSNCHMSCESYYFDGIPQEGKNKQVAASMIFQDPMTSLNPLRTIGYHLIEVILRRKKIPKKDAKRLAINELNKVGIVFAEKRMKQYPHELSGGMRQRVMIAMALLAKPKLLIADEPTTALDVTIQAQILNLIRKLQKEENLSVILVTHDFGVVSGMCQSVRVMYNGQIVEEGKTDEVFYHPTHPYTKELLSAIPSGNKKKKLKHLKKYEEIEINSTESKMIPITKTHRFLSQESPINA